MSHSGKTYAPPREIVAGIIDAGAVDFTDQLDAAVLTGTPTATVTKTAGPVSANPLIVDTLARNSGNITVNGETVAANKGITFRVDATNAVAGQKYDVLITCGHNAVSGGLKKLHCPMHVT